MDMKKYNEFVSKNTPNISANSKAIVRSVLQKNVDSFLQNGGEIKSIPPGFSGVDSHHYKVRM